MRDCTAAITKVCRECRRELPVEEFNRNKNSTDGRQVRCRACFSEYNRDRYAADPERHKSNVRKYRLSNPDAVLSTRLSICAHTPTTKNAYKAIEAAIAAGTLKRPSVCSGCGVHESQHRIEAHHHDYTKPLDVIWLCTPCHRRMDARRREVESRCEAS